MQDQVDQVDQVEISEKQQEVMALLGLRELSNGPVSVNAQVKNIQKGANWSDPCRLLVYPVISRYIEPQSLTALEFKNLTPGGYMFPLESFDLESKMFTTPDYSVKIVAFSMESEIFRILGLNTCNGLPQTCCVEVRYSSSSNQVPIPGVITGEFTPWTTAILSLYYNDAGNLEAIRPLVPPLAGWPVYTPTDFMPKSKRFALGTYAMDVRVLDQGCSSLKPVGNLGQKLASGESILPSKQYEYKVLNLNSASLDFTEKSLNRLGAEGWNLITASDPERYIFQRVKR